MGRIWLVPLILILALAACDDDDPTAPEPQPTSTAIPTATPIPTPDPANYGHWVGTLTITNFQGLPDEVVEFDLVEDRLEHGVGKFWYLVCGSP